MEKLAKVTVQPASCCIYYEILKVQFPLRTLFTSNSKFQDKKQPRLSHILEIHHGFRELKFYPKQNTT